MDLPVSGISLPLYLPGLGLADIERKAIYFNQGLPAQLLTIVGWMGAINKTYGLPPPLPLGAAGIGQASRSIAARRQHEGRPAEEVDGVLYQILI